MRKPKVSVVIATHNRLPKLVEAVASVRGQGYTDWELIVVDDASHDGTPGWLESQAGERVQVVLLDRHAERCVARNRGTEIARGDYVLYLDHDDRLRPSALSTLAPELERRPSAVAAAGGMIHFDDAGEAGRYSGPRRRRFGPMLLEALAPTVLLATGTTLYRTDAVRRAGPWDDRFIGVEDFEFSLRVLELGPAVLLPTAVLEKRGGSTLYHPAAPEALERFRLARREAVARLEPRSRIRARQVTRSFDELQGAIFAFRSDRGREGLRLGVRGFRRAPALWLTPDGRRVAANVASLALAQLPGGGFARRAWKRLRETTHRFVPGDASVRRDQDTFRAARRRWRRRRAQGLLARPRGPGTRRAPGP